MEALFGVYGVNFGQKRGQSRPNQKTCMFHWHFESSPTGGNKARDLKIGMLVHHIRVCRTNSVFYILETRKNPKFSKLLSFFDIVC